LIVLGKFSPRARLAINVPPLWETVIYYHPPPHTPYKHITSLSGDSVWSDTSETQMMLSKPVSKPASFLKSLCQKPEQGKCDCRGLQLLLHISSISYSLTSLTGHMQTYTRMYAHTHAPAHKNKHTHTPLCPNSEHGASYLYRKTT
jgi:hypothetical protein